MAQGVSAGRLSIEIVAEVARLQQDLDKAKRAVKSMSSDIVRDTRAANDNLARMGSGFVANSDRVVKSAGAQRAGMAQLSMQLNDVATMYALGAKPQQIFASQSGQVLQAIMLLSGGTSKFATFLMGPWGMALTTAAIVVTPFIGKLFEAEDAVKKVEFASYKFGDAQSILGNVLDLTTGKIKNQTDAMIALARAQLVQGQIEARRDQADARKDMIGIRKGSVGISGGMGGGFRFDRTGDASAGVVSAFQEGSLSLKEAERSLNSLRKTGTITEESYLKAAAAVTKFGVAAENLKVFQDAEKGLNGDVTALQQFLKPSTQRTTRTKTGPSQADIAARFAGEMESWTQRNLRAQMELTTDTEERAELEKRSIEWSRKQSVAEIEHNKLYSAEQKLRLLNMVEANNGFELEIAERNRRREVERQADDLREVAFDRQRTLLQQAGALADTQEDRKQIALQILALEQEERRSTLERTAANKDLDAAVRKRAQAILEGLDAVESGERNVTARSNETSAERYLREFTLTRDQMNEAFDEIKVRGLESLNDGIVDAIVNFKSLGDMASNVIRQILAELLRLQIQKAIIGPLAKALGLAAPSSGPVDLLVGTPYAGGRALGGAVSAGRTYVVGENGPEVVTMGSHGFVTPNDRLSSSNKVAVEIVDTTGLFVTRVNGQIMQTAPAVMQGGANIAKAQIAQHNRRRVA